LPSILTPDADLNGVTCDLEGATVKGNFWHLFVVGFLSQVGPGQQSHFLSILGERFLDCF
jgi:hypothetical protein